MGRTARAGMTGLAISFVTQFDVEIFLGIENFIGKKIDEIKFREEEVLKWMSKTSIAKRKAIVYLEDIKFDERKESYKKKKGKKVNEDLIERKVKEKERKEELEKNQKNESFENDEQEKGNKKRMIENKKTPSSLEKKTNHKKLNEKLKKRKFK